MKMSVMLITYNRKLELLKAIESCINNRMDDMEIVIVDNHSTDGTRTEAEHLLIEKQMPYQYYYSEENLGVSGGRNLAFGLCEGEYVFCLDDDAIIETKSSFQKIYRRMKSNLNAVAAAIEIYEPESEKFLKGYVYEKNGIMYAHSYIGAAHVLKRDVFAGRKLYPSKLQFGSEEAYIAYRIWGMGKKMLYLDDVRVLHLPSATARVYGNDRKLNIIINNYIIRKLCYPKMMFPVLYLAFRNRLWRHDLLKERSYQDIRKIIEERYDESEADRMLWRALFRMIRTVSINWVI